MDDILCATGDQYRPSDRRYPQFSDINTKDNQFYGGNMRSVLPQKMQTMPPLPPPAPQVVPQIMPLAPQSARKKHSPKNSTLQINIDANVLFHILILVVVIYLYCFLNAAVHDLKLQIELIKNMVSAQR
jgi:hypothetical protein